MFFFRKVKKLRLYELKHQTDLNMFPRDIERWALAWQNVLLLPIRCRQPMPGRQPGVKPPGWEHARITAHAHKAHWDCKIWNGPDWRIAEIGGGGVVCKNLQINAGISRISLLPIRPRVCLTRSKTMVITLHRSTGSWLICVLDQPKTTKFGKNELFYKFVWFLSSKIFLRF